MSEDFGIAIGTANYSGNRKRTFKLEANKQNEYRILPPLGEAAKKGTWIVPYAVHWGDKGSDGKMKPYLCIQRREKLPDGTYKITQRCGRCEKSAKVKELRDNREAQMKTQGLSKEAIDAKLKTIDEYMRQYNRGFRFYCNALNTKMEIGRLDMPARHKDQLQEQINNLLKANIDATSPQQGVYFNFFYAGKDGHSVSPVTEAGATPGSLQLKMAPLTANIMRNLKDEHWDLTDLFTSISEADIDRLVQNEGNSEVVDNVFSGGKVEKKAQAAAAAAANVTFNDGLDNLIGGNKVTTTVTTTAAPALAPVATPAPAVQAAPVIQQAAPVAPPAQTIASMSDDDFESQFGV